MTAVLEASGVSKTFGAITAASDLNVQVPERAVYSLIGTNGAGKTTFVNMVTGYITPDDGRITFAGRDITGSTRARSPGSASAARSRSRSSVQRPHGAGEHDGRPDHQRRGAAVLLETGPRPGMRWSGRSTCWRASAWATSRTG